MDVSHLVLCADTLFSPPTLCHNSPVVGNCWKYVSNVLTSVSIDVTGSSSDKLSACGS